MILRFRVFCLEILQKNLADIFFEILPVIKTFNPEPVDFLLKGNIRIGLKVGSMLSNF